MERRKNSWQGMWLSTEAVVDIKGSARKPVRLEERFELDHSGRNVRRLN